jgi:hypothetical protein
MLVAAIALVAGLSCPKDFGVLDTTIGAFNTSSALNVCAAKAQVFSSGGKIVLVLGGSETRPQCLVYPGGRTPDLARLLLSDHVGCFSLYPPSQPVAIVNLGSVASPKLSSAMAKFAPALVRSFVSSPKTLVGQKVSFSSNASATTVRATLLGLPIKARFKVASTNWHFDFSDGTVVASSAAKPSFVMRLSGQHTAKLQAGFYGSFQIVGNSVWHSVPGVIVLLAAPIAFEGLSITDPSHPPTAKHRRPVLVARDCLVDPQAFGCQA